MPEDESEIADKNFFLADDGKTDAASELEATIYALYNEKRFDDNSTACLFPARKHWLTQELGMKNLPEVECYDFDLLIKLMEPNSASLIFPFVQGSSPSSMFGHTFLRVDSKSNPKMLSYAFNYASEYTEGEDNQLMYMYKGFFGGYKGSYSLLPYYEKIKEYRDLEERDIWEYDLNFTKEETKQMVRHMWEVELNYSWYYFFTKNCSYKMFWMMEAARPGLNLRKYFNFHIIPSETIRATIDEGLVTKQHYRPARSSKLKAYEGRFEKEDVESVFNISSDKLDPSKYINNSNIDQQTKRFVLDASAEFVEYDYLKKDINSSIYQDRIYKILKVRATLGEGEHIKIPIPTDPMLSHRSFRVSADIGIRNNQKIGFLGVRPANHSIDDFDIGYIAGTQVEFMDLLFSYEKDDFNIEKATIISIASLAPKSEFFKPTSWRFSTGVDRNYLSDNAEFTAKYATGLTWGNSNTYLYVLADFLLYSDNYLTLGVGGVMGAVLHEGSDFKTNIELSQRIYNTIDTQLLFSASQHYRSSQNTALSLSYDYVQKYKRDYNTLKVSFDYFF